MSSSDFPEDRIAFAVGTGRCGTKFICRVLELEKSVASVHERNPPSDTFHRYCKWYGISVDHEGFLAAKKREIESDLETFDYSFESSAYLSLSVIELYERFNAKFILLVRKPHEVVASYLRKGWYDKPFVRSNPDLPPTTQDCELFHHFLGRIVPSGEKFTVWQNMSRVGKLAWYWNALNAKVIEQFSHIPADRWRIQKLEDFSYEQYLNIAGFLGFKPTVSARQFDALAATRPNALDNIPSIASWNSTEIQEFETEVAPVADYFGYEYRISQLVQ